MSETKPEAPYFQFPLCALAYGTDEQERLNAIIDYSVVSAGQKLYAKLPDDQSASIISTAKRPSGFDTNSKLHRAVVVGLERLNVSSKSMPALLEWHGRVAVFIEAFQQRHGHDAEVRLRANLVFEARDGKPDGITYQELSVLAAIYSVIGDKKKVRITQATLRHRALGYKSAGVMAAELPRRLDKAKALTDWILRDTVNRLKASGFFSRMTYGRRQTFYSNRLTDQELQDEIVASKTRRADSQWNQRTQDDLMTAKIRALRAKGPSRSSPVPSTPAAGPSPPPPPAPPTKPAAAQNGALPSSPAPYRKPPWD